MHELGSSSDFINLQNPIGTSIQEYGQPVLWYSFRHDPTSAWAHDKTIRFMLSILKVKKFVDRSLHVITLEIQSVPMYFNFV